MISTDSSNAISSADTFELHVDHSLSASVNRDSLSSDGAYRSTLRFEAEAMNLENYRIERIDFASGGAVASFVGEGDGEQGSANFQFSQKAGIYDVVVGYFDEEGGSAEIDPILNGQSLGAIRLNDSLGDNVPTAENFVRKTVESGLFLDEWAVFSIRGFEDAGEHARIDYIEFIWVGEFDPSAVSEPEDEIEAVLPDPLRINVGGKDYVDEFGQYWMADRYFEDGSISQTNETIRNTSDAPIYQSGRYAKTMDYHIPVANGIYTVDLHFAEVQWSAADQRTFNIEIEDERKRDRLDVYREAGKNSALTRAFTSILVTDGILDLHLGAQKDYAQLSGIEISAQTLLGSDLSSGLNSDSDGAIRVNSGGDRYTDSNGNVWLADTFYDDGRTSNRSNSIQGTPDDPLYQSERYAKTLDYSVAVANGTYRVNLLFAETHWSEAGKRSFNVTVEDRLVAEDVDLYREVGKFRAYNQLIESVTVTDGKLDIALESDVDYAKLSGFEIVPVDVASDALQDSPILPESPASAPSEATPFTSNATVRYISPEGGGDGSSWQQAANLSDLDRLIEQSAPGDEIWIAGDLGAYDVSSQVVSIDSGSDASAAIYIRGVASQQGGNDKPLFVGDRAENWTPGQSNGDEVFKLLNGANHLHFSNLSFKNVGNGAFRFGGDIKGVTLENMEASNVRRFVENHVSGDANTATVTDLTIKDIDVRGFSKGAIRLQYDSNNILIEDVFGDAQGQDGDNFTMGVHLLGSVHDVVHRNVTMNNAIQKKGEDDYWNADGFVTEWGTYDIIYEDTFAAGSTDGGYDLKSENTTLIRAGAADNKRNFRIWRTANFIDVKSEEPFKRGGTGTTAHIHVLGDEGNVTIKGGTFSGDKDIENIIFDLDDKGSLTLEDATITDNNYILKTVGEQGNISLDNLKEVNPA